MMSLLQRRMERLARAEQRRQIARLAARWTEQLRGARVEVMADKIVITGRGLVQRWLVDPALRFISGSPA